MTIKTAHEVSITYVTGGLTLVTTIHDNLVLATGDQRENSGPIETFMIKMQPNLAIAQYEELQVLV
ncbi:MAG: hypothetical protein ABIN91_18145 [Mucilaginibacter sp.]|uniref:hypothetical protein n=1 Tax=Mucilaginibacter sp. TaxID=1882438 RepID=UPI0032644941